MPEQADKHDTAIKRAGMIGSLALLLVSLGVAAAWGWSAHREATDQNQRLMLRSVDGAAAEIRTLLQELRRSVNILAENEQALVAAVAQDPAADAPYFALSQRLRQHFPEMYAFTLADEAGTPLLFREEEYVGRGCKADIRRFAEDPLVAHVTLHPSPDSPHFDIMGQWRLPDGRSGVFFISFRPEMLSRLLSRHERPGHSLLMLSNRRPGMVEVTALGAGDDQLGEVYLDEQERADITARAAILGTRWTLVAWPEQQMLEAAVAEVLRWSLALFAGLMVVGLTVISLLLRESRRRSSAEQALLDEQERAQVTLDAIGDAVIVTQPSGLVSYLNPVAERLIGRPLEQVRGLKLTEVFSPIDEQTRQHDLEPWLAVQPRQALLGSGESAAHLIEYRASLMADQGCVITCRDVTETRALARQLVYQANHDALTGLLNRYAFSRVLRNSLNEVGESRAQHALLYIDLDQFKLVNDTAGHVAGDALLRQVATQLGSALGERDLLARLGGDEFAVLLFDCTAEQAVASAERLIASVRESTFDWERRSFRIGASIGIVPLRGEISDTVQVLTQADVACYTAKDQGRNRAFLYSPEEGQLSWHHGELHRAVELETMLADGSFVLHAQPIVPLQERLPHRYELLLRIRDADGHEHPPGAFISAAERFGMMGAIDRWVVNNALLACTDAFADGPGQLCINLSGGTLCDQETVDYIALRVRDAALPPGKLCFEITETAVVTDPEAAMRFIAELKTLGCTIALDDFGSGVASFASLKALPVDLLKIDGSLVRRIAEDDVDRAMVAAIHQMASALSLSTVAEWVEDDRTVRILREMGIDYGQGWGLGKPIPLSDLLARDAARSA